MSSLESVFFGYELITLSGGVSTDTVTHPPRFMAASAKTITGKMRIFALHHFKCAILFNYIIFMINVNNPLSKPPA